MSIEINRLALELINSNYNQIKFNKLLKLLKLELGKYCWKYCKTKLDVEESVHWTLKKIIKNILKYNPEKGNFTSWAYTIAHNETLYYLHYEKINNHREFDIIQPFIEYEDTSDASILKKIIIEDAYDKTISAIFNMPDSLYKTIAIEKIVKNKKIKEISEEYNINENTVKTKLTKIKLMIKDTVNQENPNMVEKLKNIL
jgi:RNA polymerase sigma factor (sigma-70 family)